MSEDITYIENGICESENIRLCNRGTAIKLLYEKRHTQQYERDAISPTSS